jgi:cation diffusion facilitator family transporter
VLVIIAAAVSTPKEDKKYNYGREKWESIITLFFSLVLAATGVWLVMEGIIGLGRIKESSVNFYLIFVTIFSIATKEAMFWFTIHYAKLTKSGALKADAWHHRTDALSSAAVLIGLLFALFIKTDLMESIAVIIVALLIIKVAFDILRISVWQLTDKAADGKTRDKIIDTVKKIDGVLSIDELNTRLFGAAIFVDIEIGVNEDLSITEAHAISDRVHDNVEKIKEVKIKHCHVHVNPSVKK